jgi:hypothetical protein
LVQLLSKLRRLHRSHQLDQLVLLRQLHLCLKPNQQDQWRRLDRQDQLGLSLREVRFHQ